MQEKSINYFYQLINMKQCCKKAIKNYLRNKALSALQCVAGTEQSIKRQDREQLIAFIEGMKNL